MACKHCVSDGMCDIKKEHPVNCWYLDNEQEQNQCHFYVEGKEDIDIIDGEHVHYTKFEKISWWTSLVVMYIIFIIGLVLTVNSTIIGEFTLTQGIIFGLMIIGVGVSVFPVVKNTLKIFKLDKEQ